MGGSYSKKAHDELVNAIFTGKLRFGQTLNQNKLTGTLNMSRTPIREALFALEQEGLLSRDGRSYTISYISKEEVVELYEARILLESQGAYFCAQRMNRESKKRLKAHMEYITKVKEEKSANLVERTELNGELHKMISFYGGNRYIYKFMQEVILKLTLVRIALFTIEGGEEEEFQEHRRIVDAVISMNPELSKQLMHEHLTNVLDYVKDKVIPKLYWES